MDHDSPDHQQPTGPRSDPDQRQAERIVAPVIVSTRAATGQREDMSAPIIAEFAERMGFGCRPPVIIPDGEGVLAALSELLSAIAPEVIITSGGTGLTPDDLTPEFTEPLLDKQIPGIMEAVRTHARRTRPMAAVNRGMAGVAEGTVIINLPGAPQAVREGMEVLVDVLPGLCDQVADLRPQHDWGEVVD